METPATAIRHARTFVNGLQTVKYVTGWAASDLLRQLSLLRMPLGARVWRRVRM